MLKAADGETRSIGDQTIVWGDCLKVMRGMKASSIDVVVTSPPYNLKLPYRTYADTRIESEYLDWLVEVAEGIKRVLADDGSFFLNMSGSSSRPWLPFELITRLRSTFILQNHITWVKSITTGAASTGHFKPIAGQRFVHQNHEHIFHLTKTGSVPLDRLAIGVPFADKSNIARRGHARDLRCRGNTWFIPYETVNSKSKKFSHPCIFPTELPLWCIYLHGKENAEVLDPFMGAGSSLVAAQLSGSKGIGIDIDSSYVDIAGERLKSISGAKMNIQLNDSEMQSLLKQAPETKKDGGFQSLLVGLQGKLNRSTGHLSLTESDVERIAQYAFGYGNGGWENRLKEIFGRNLGPKLGRKDQAA